MQESKLIFMVHKIDTDYYDFPVAVTRTREKAEEIKNKIDIACKEAKNFCECTIDIWEEDKIYE